MPADLTAALADRYSLRRVLGRGGMATVYLADDRKHHRAVALKVLLPGLAAYLGAERFLKEIQIAARGRGSDRHPVWLGVTYWTARTVYKRISTRRRRELENLTNRPGGAGRAARRDA